MALCVRFIFDQLFHVLSEFLIPESASICLRFLSTVCRHNGHQICGRGGGGGGGGTGEDNVFSRKYIKYWKLWPACEVFQVDFKLRIEIFTTVKQLTSLQKGEKQGWVEGTGWRVSVEESIQSPGGTPYNGLYGEAPSDRGSFFTQRVGISRVEVYERVGKSVI